MNGVEFLEINGFELRGDDDREDKRILLNFSECESITLSAFNEHDSDLKCVLVRLKNGREFVGTLDQRKIEMYTTKTEVELLKAIGFSGPTMPDKDK